ncbi:Maf family protein [Candidatus Electronema sp. PJ]|uniref:Maf family protein n=1 Tax=Candidatus Electronema sp. PJ TaxID=3401572 RepID=UPI003AA82AE3
MKYIREDQVDLLGAAELLLLPGAVLINDSRLLFLLKNVRLTLSQRMFTLCKPLILASASPRRKQFLSDLGLHCLCLPAALAEIPLPEEMPAAFALRMAEEKVALIAQQHPESWVLGADTVVTLDNQIIGKPIDANQALAILRTLRGQTHQVITGLALICRQANCVESLTETTEVTFADFPDEVLAAYVNTGEPLDKAGAYGIQAGGAFLVRNVQGSCSNVIGLPVDICLNLLLRHGIIAAAVKTGLVF